MQHKTEQKCTTYATKYWCCPKHEVSHKQYFPTFSGFQDKWST